MYNFGDHMSFQYSVPVGEVRHEHLAANSRFVATLAPVFSVKEARAFIARIKREFTGASHNVPAYIVGGGNTRTEYCSDDGEPPGTAGKPALTVLRGSGLGDVAVVITRYFGGTLLGKGGLVKAYTASAQLVVSAVARGERLTVHTLMLAIPYNLLERIRLMSERYRAEIMEQAFGADITMTLRIPVDRMDGFQSELRELSAGKLHAEVLDTTDAIFKVSQNT